MHNVKRTWPKEEEEEENSKENDEIEKEQNARNQYITPLHVCAYNLFEFEDAKDKIERG